MLIRWLVTVVLIFLFLGQVLLVNEVVSTIRVALALILVSLVFYLLTTERGFPRLFLFIAAFAIVLVIFSLLGSLVAVWPGYSLLNAGSVALLVLGLGVLISVASSEAMDVQIAWSVAGLSLLSALYALLFFFFGGDVAPSDGALVQGFGASLDLSQRVHTREGDLRYAGPFSNANTLGYVLFFGIVCVFYLWRLWRLKTPLFFLCTAILVSGIVLSGSRAAAASVSVFVLILIGAAMLRGVHVRFTSTIFVSLFNLLPYLVVFFMVVGEGGGLIDTSFRIEIWEHGIDQAFDRGVSTALLGSGLGSGLVELGDGRAYSPHNLVLRILLEQGIVGLVLFHALLSVTIFGLFHEYINSGSAKVRSALVVSLSGVSALLVHQQLEAQMFLLNWFTAAWFSFILSVAVWARRENRCGVSGVV